MHLWSDANLRKLETNDSLELEEPAKRKLIKTEEGAQRTRVDDL